MVPDDAWVPVALGHGPVCQACGQPARWLRRLILRRPGGKPVTNRIWRCDAHATAAPFGTRGCPHQPGRCLPCAHADPLADLDPNVMHHQDGACRPARSS